MKELRDIVQSYEEAIAQGKRAALATVVQIDGSSYRQPGARMLVTEDGTLTGAISGGCLEGDALRKALLVIADNQPMLVTYDTSDDDDTTLGIGLGCNGIIQILIEPIDTGNPFNPISLIKHLLAVREPAVLVTRYSMNERKLRAAGTSVLVRRSGAIYDPAHKTLSGPLSDIAEQAFTQNKSLSGIRHNEFSLLISLVAPVLTLVIAGAGNDVKPIVSIADTMGWDTVVVDGRSNYATQNRFPLACRVIAAKPEKALEQVKVDKSTVFLLMTHNYNYDLALLKHLLLTDSSYIGILGPRKKMLRMMSELADAGIIPNEDQISKIFGPTGLDIGAENAEEIALSICAEISAVMNERQGGSLRLGKGSIHEKQNNQS